MNDLVKWISCNPLATMGFIVAASAALTYLIAFFQGRAISFWPPRIEGLPVSLPQGEPGSMAVMQAIRIRKSVRSYADKPVEDDKLNTILEAARLAPSASNRQEWRFVIVRRPENRSKVAAASSSLAAFVGRAPVVMAACAETDEHVMQCGQLSYPIDVAIALDHMTLAAVELGLGTCWIGMFDEAKVKAALDIPDKVRVVALMTLGYPANPSVITKKRLPLGEIAKYEHY